ncbi:MAG: glycine--tRNA ligase subunit beta, partial [Proteobacteria bacterium]|nr:glycine--tRNA ligase subunit beta [Pseudomonadota bacterium]
LGEQPKKKTERLGPTLTAAFDADGNPTPAALGFARSCGVEVSELARAHKGGVEKLSFSTSEAGASAQHLLPGIVSAALDKLPIPKPMRWGSSRQEFVRPVHWVLMLYGDECIDTRILGVSTGATTRGHRFLYNHDIEVHLPAEYESLLEETGSVIPDFEKRKEYIRKLVTEEGDKVGATVVVDESLLDEVTGLVEFPVALTGKFDPHFLDVPPEALIIAMKSHQRYFYLLDGDAKLIPYFITVSNIRSTDPAQVIAGNERVIRPRLADARFFYELDKKSSLESRVEQLKQIVFHQQLGSVFDKSQRVASLAVYLAEQLGADPAQCRRAALLSKCDLVTSMVGEFADLQGRMGYYYALNDGEDPVVATAIDEQYMPRFSGDSVPTSLAGSVLAIADKLDSMLGMFAIGQPPTGSRDPFALRRSAIGILRILVENKLDLNILKTIERAASGFDHVDIEHQVCLHVFEFLLDRFRSWYTDQGISIDVFQSVMALKPQRPLDFHERILAVQHFSKLQQAQSLSAANKRVSNLLSKLDDELADSVIDASLLVEPAEKDLYKALTHKMGEVVPLFDQGRYKDGLQQLASLRESVDRFFDSVLVMSEDQNLRNNRVALLQQLRSLFLRVADISYLHKS